MSDWIDLVLRSDAERIRSAGGLILLHDWRTIETYEPGARQVMLARIRAREKGYAKSTSLVIQATPMMKMAVQVANVALAMLGNSSVRVHHDIGGILPMLRGVEPGPAPSWAR